jgi:hypothetical protein
MPLEIEFRSAHGSNLGRTNEVQQAIAAVLPGTQFCKELSGSEKIRIAREAGVEFPLIVREQLEKMEASYRGDYEGEGFSMEFWFGSSETVDRLHVDIRGTGDAPEALRAIVAATGWKAFYLATGAELTEADWLGFQAWRDKSIRNMKSRCAPAPNAGPAGSLGDSEAAAQPPPGN